MASSADEDRKPTARPTILTSVEATRDQAGEADAAPAAANAAAPATSIMDDDDNNNNNNNNRAAASAATSFSTPLTRLHEYFLNTMTTDQVKLLASWEDYVKMLPTRESGDHRVLIAGCPFWAKEDLVTHLAKLLEERGETERGVLPYLAAPSHSGKTACILVGFLNSVESTRKEKFAYYLYLAFSNNNDKHFAFNENTSVTDTKLDAEKQGAHFAFQCVRHLMTEGALDRQQVYKYVDDPSLLPSVSETVQKIEALLAEKLPGGESHGKVLFHVDEHHQMNVRDGNFRRGALEALARCRAAACVATYTKIPAEVPPLGSSYVCRRPVPKPGLDMTQVMCNVPELDLHSLEHNTPSSSRKWATLAFKMAMRIRPTMMNIHLSAEKRNSTTQDFLQEFNKRRKTGNIDKCLTYCHTDTKAIASKTRKGALHLMVGVSDDAEDGFDFKASGLTVAKDGMVTGALESLLDMDDSEYPVFGQGRRCFARALNQAKRTEDILSATPLEAAFIWSLSCVAALKGALVFSPNSSDFEFPFRAKQVRSGRIFIGSDKEKVITDFEKVKKDTLYYVDEKKTRGGPTKASHPLCDMFFRSDRDELVLIDVTGGTIRAEDKVTNMKRWLDSTAAAGFKCEKFGVVLAPGQEGSSFETGPVCAVLGQDAMDLLGALTQCYDWLIVD